MAAFRPCITRMPPRLTQSFSGRIREHLEEIESRLFVGVPRAGVVAEFRLRGIELGTVTSFPSALYHARRTAKRQGISQALMTETTTPKAKVVPAVDAVETNALQPALSTQPAKPNERKFQYGAHDPRRIDEVLRNPRDMEELRKRGLEMAREHAKKNG